MRDGRLEGAAITSRFPVAFPLPAFASRSSDSRRGIGPSSRSAYRARRGRVRTPTGLPRSARTSCDRVGALYTPRTAVLIPAEGRAQPAPTASQRPVLSPRHQQSTDEGRFTRHQRGFKRFARPIFPSPVAPRWNGSPRAFPRASHPAVTGSARRGWGQAIEHGPGTALYDISRASNPARSLVCVRPRVAPSMASVSE
jgi:hypothetical protein